MNIKINKIKKLCENRELSQAHKLVYMWVKQKAINFAEFVELVELIALYDKPINL